MSRHQFRAKVDERPASAWLLVCVASSLLWITEQLEAWVIVVEVAAILLSLSRRTRPFAWQSSPIALNIGMFGIAGTTISLALDGSPATLSLAHFAALTQGLQLVDSRPRKSEFLLVTLALFQVVLAANLTDSLLFPPLLAIFVVSAVWTLLVHTLRSEAIEADDPGATARAITPGLRRVTAVASVASIVLAIVLFAFLPRMRTSMLQSGLAGSQAIAGFSDRVELGTIGRIRSDRRVVLRVETLEGVAPPPIDAYWRGLAFDSFDGRRWAITPSDRTTRPGSVKFGISLGAGPEAADLVQLVVREPVSSGVIFGAGIPRHVTGALLYLEGDENGGLYDPLQANQRVRYTIATESHDLGDDQLVQDRAAPPRKRGPRYLALPDLAPEVAALAAAITGDLETDAERARSIELHLRHHGRYTDTPPPLGDGEGQTPIEDFLMGELAGHCEYFASGMVVLARSVGLPSRLVNGFAGGRENPLGGFIELTRADAHAWVEVHYQDAGWVRYDPTPPDLRLRAAGSLSLAEHFAALGSTIELWWFQRVVDFDSSDQIRAIKSGLAAWKRFRTPTESERDRPKGLLSRWQVEHSLRARSLMGALVAFTLASILVLNRRRRHQARPLPEAYRRALALLARRGLVRGEHQTARHFSARIGDVTTASAAAAFAELTEAYLAERFGAHCPGNDGATPLRVLGKQLRGYKRQPRDTPESEDSEALVGLRNQPDIVEVLATRAHPLE